MASQRRQSNRNLSTNYRPWRIQWNDQNCLELIDLYHEKTELWDSKDPHYTNRLAKIAAWKYISSYFLCSEDEIKLRIESLRQKYWVERYREASRIEVYKSKWFAYDSFHFLRRSRNKRKSTNDCNNDKICQKQGVSTRSAVNMNSVRNSYISKHFNEQRNQFSSPRKLTRMTREKSSSSDEATDVPNYLLIHNECSSFADHVKIKLKKFSLQDRAIVMHKINNIIFEAELKKYGHCYNVESQFKSNLKDSNDKLIDPISVECTWSQPKRECN